MTCRDLLESIEAIAAGELLPDEATRAHIESCPRCAAELASARRIEALLQARVADPAPPRFTTAVLQRVRRERWRTEQNVDRLFNVAIAVALVLVAAGVLALLNLGGLLSVAATAWDVATGAAVLAARSAAPSFETYLAGAALLISALGMWWWADRSLSM